MGVRDLRGLEWRMHEESEPFAGSQVGYARCEWVTRGVSNGVCTRRVRHLLGRKWGSLEASELFEGSLLGNLLESAYLHSLPWLSHHFQLCPCQMRDDA